MEKQTNSIRGILICGFSGTGKSSFLKQQLPKGWHGYDIDEEFEKRERSSIREYFANKGEASFRERELQVLKAVLTESQGPFLVALGAGGFSKTARELCREYQVITVWFDLSFSLCWERIKDDGRRPLVLQGRESMEKRFKERQVDYGKADFSVRSQEELIAFIEDRNSSHPHPTSDLPQS